MPICRPRPVMRKSLAGGGAASGARQHGEAAGITATHPGQVDDEPAGGRGSNRGSCSRDRDGCDAGFAAERGDGMGASVRLRKGPGREGRCPGPSRTSGRMRRAGLPGARPSDGCMRHAQLRGPRAGPVPVSRVLAPAAARRAPRGGRGRRRWRVPGWRVRAAGGVPGSGSGCGGRLSASPGSRLWSGR